MVYLKGESNLRKSEIVLQEGELDLQKSDFFAIGWNLFAKEWTNKFP